MSSRRTLEEEYKKLLSSHRVDLDSFAQGSDYWNAYREMAKRGQDYSVGHMRVPTWLKDYPADINLVWESIGRSIETPAKEMAKKVAPLQDTFTPSLTRVFPTGSMNAQASPHSSGVLILINSGLMGFMLEFILILLAYDGTRSRLMPKAAPREGLTTFGAVAGIGSLLLRYIATNGYQPSQGFKRFLRLGSDPPEILQLLFGECMSFVVAHEYGHLALGHVGVEGSVRAKKTPVGMVSLCEKRKEEEFEADLNAVLTLISLRDDWQLHLPFQLAGIYIFLCMDDFIDRLVRMQIAAKGIDLPVLLDHPPASDRFDRIADRFDQVLPGGGIFGIFRAIQASLLEIRDDSLQLAMAGLDSKATSGSYWETLELLRARLSEQ